MGKLKDLYDRLFCKHDWELLSHTKLSDRYGCYAGERWVYRCKKCGQTTISTDDPYRNNRRYF